MVWNSKTEPVLKVLLVKTLHLWASSGHLPNSKSFKANMSRPAPAQSKGCDSHTCQAQLRHGPGTQGNTRPCEAVIPGLSQADWTC